MSESNSENRLQSILSMLSHLGWSMKKHPETNQFSEELSRTNSESKTASWTALHLPKDQVLLIVSSNLSLDGYEESYKKFEDLSFHHREILSWLSADKIVFDFVLMLDEQGGSLIDGNSEEVLLHVRTRREMEERLLPLLNITSLTAGSLVAYPRKTIRHHAQELHCWTEFWAKEIGSQIKAPLSDVRPFLESIHMTRLALKRNVISSLSENVFLEFNQQNKFNSALNEIKEASKKLQETSNFLHLHPFDEDQRLWKCNGLKDALISYSLISAEKIQSSVFADAFADEELQEVSAKAVFQDRISGVSDSLIDVQSWQYNPNEFDLDKHGTLLLLKSYDQLVSQVIEDSRKQKASIERGERPGTQLDLLADDPPAINEKNAPAIILRSGLKVMTSNTHRKRLVRHILLARAAEWYDKLNQPAPVFPMIQTTVRQQSAPRIKSVNQVAGFQNFQLN